MSTRAPIELRIHDDRISLQDPAAVPERVRADLERCLERLNRELGRGRGAAAPRVWPFLLSLLGR